MRHPTIFALSILLSALMCACGDDDADGSGCDVETPDAGCGTGLVCAEQPDGSGRCQIPAGGPCDLDAADPNCRAGSACFAESSDSAAAGEEPGALCLVLESGICDPLAPFCVDGLTCAEIEDQSRRCFAPVFVRGTVVDAADGAGIADAHVVALDEESVAATDIAVSGGPTGAYQLELPATRDVEGRPVDARYTLRGAAAGYQTFPGGLRTALPLSTSTALLVDGA